MGPRGARETDGTRGVAVAGDRPAHLTLTDAVTRVVQHAHRARCARCARCAGRPPAAGRPHVVAVDGRSGAGKSTLAAAVVDRLSRGGTDVALLSMEDLYRGWDGLDAGAALLAREVLAPLADGQDGSYRAWDWSTGAPGQRVRVPRTDLLVVDGVGSGAAVGAAASATLVWLSAPAGVRKARALARDGATYAPHWDAWAASETAHHTRERTRERADLAVELSGGNLGGLEGPGSREAGGPGRVPGMAAIDPKNPDDVDQVWEDFHAAVNMTSRELMDWLRTRAAGPETEETRDQAGPATGQQVLHVLSKRRTDVTPEDVDVMRGVSDAIRARRGEDLEDGTPVAGDDAWRRELMDLGHDPLKPA